MREIEAKGIAGVLKVGRVNRTHRGFRYLTGVRRMAENLRWVAAFGLPTHLTKWWNPVGRVRVRFLEVFGHYHLRHPD